MAVKPELRRPLLFSVIWLDLWLVLAGWTAYRLAQSWPYVNSHTEFVLLLAVPGVLFRGGDIAYMLMAGNRVARWKRAGARALALVVGFVLAVFSWDALDRVSMQRFEAAIAPLVTQVARNAAAPCPPAARYAIGASLLAYLDASNAPRAPLKLHADKSRFVIEAAGYSADIDGSTVFYDSKTRAWRKVHNDALARTQEFSNLVAGLEECKLPLR